MGPSPLAATGTRRLEATIKPGLDALLAESSRRYEHSLATTPAVESPRRRANTAGVVASDNPNDFRHNASTTDHVNNRANMAVAIMMKHYDLAAGEAVYTDTPPYAYLSAWIDGMRAPGAVTSSARTSPPAADMARVPRPTTFLCGGFSAPACRNPDIGPNPRPLPCEGRGVRAAAGRCCLAGEAIPTATGSPFPLERGLGGRYAYPPGRLR